MKVLIVDDSSLLRERLSDLLSQTIEVELVIEAQDRLEAIDSVQRLTPDVAIVDIRLPKDDGIQTLVDLKKIKPDMHVIMLTNYPYREYREKCLAEGADFFLDKSTEFERIPRIVEQLIQGNTNSSSG